MNIVPSTQGIEKLHLSWAEVDAKIDTLAVQIQRRQLKFDRIVSIANGGVYIGQRLADFFGVPHESIRISRYDGMGKRPEPIVSGFMTQPTGNLIVDDLVDEGFTLELFDAKFGLAGNHAAVLYHSPGVPKAIFNEIKPRAWICFPWPDGD